MIGPTKNAQLAPDEVIVLIPPDDFIKVDIVKTPLSPENWTVRTGDVYWAIAGSIDAAVSVAREHDPSKDASVSIRVVSE